MGKRLHGFDYARPYFYMVTLRRKAGAPALSRVCGEKEQNFLAPNALTRAFSGVIRDFHKTWYCIEPIQCYSIMPDHIHLLVKIRDAEPRVGLPVIVRMLERSLEKEWAGFGSANEAPAGPGEAGPGTTPSVPLEGDQGARKLRVAEQKERSGGPLFETIAQPPEAKAPQKGATAARYESCGGALRRAPIFESSWHDWIVSSKGQLAAFTRYIRENPQRSWLRQSHPEYFRRVRSIGFLGHTWYGYGNAELLKLPVLEPMRYSRRIAEGSPAWEVAVEVAGRIGPGGAGIGTFMSPLEKACGHAIGLAGGRWIVLSPEGFGERWHPGRQYEKFCAQGRMLFLSLWPAMERKPTKAELYQRCHEMGAIVEALSERDQSAGGAWRSRPRHDS